MMNKKAQQLDETITWFVAFILICFVVLLFVGFTATNASTLLLDRNSIKVTNSLQEEKNFDFNTQNAINFIDFFNKNKVELSPWVDDNSVLTNADVYQIMNNVIIDSEKLKAYENYNVACTKLKEFLSSANSDNADICIQPNGDNVIENIFATKNSNEVTCGIHAIGCPRTTYISRSFPIISQESKQIEVFYND